MSLGEESLSTEVFLIDMLYSPVCAVLGETHKVVTDRKYPSGRMCCMFVLLFLLWIDILFKVPPRQQGESEGEAQQLQKYAWKY